MPTITKYAGSATAVVGTWSNTGNAVGSSTTAYTTNTQTTTAQKSINLSGYNFAADIPAGSTVTAVTYTVRQYVSSATVFNNPGVRAYSGGTAIGTSDTSITERTSANTSTFTPATIPTAEELRASDFTMRFLLNRATTGTGTQYLGFIGVNVTYDLPKIETAQLTTWTGQSLFTLGGTGHSIVGGKLQMQTVPGYPMTYTAQAYDLTNSHFYADFGPIPNNASGGPEFYLGVHIGTTANTNSAQIIWAGNNFNSLLKVGGTQTEGTWTPYNAATHRHFRIRETSGTLFWEFSANGTTWTVHRSIATPWTATSAYGVFISGDWGGTPNVQTMTVGAVNFAPVTANPWSTVTLTGTGTGTWAQTSGTPVLLSTSGATATFTAPPSMAAQTLVFTYNGQTFTVDVKAATTAIITAGGVAKPLRLAVGKASVGSPAVDATIRSSSTATIAYPDPTNPISRPPTVVEGDLLLLFFSTDWGDAGAGNTFMPPAEFTQLFEYDKGDNLGKLGAAYRVATASEPASYLIGAAEDGAVRADLYAIRDWSGNPAEIVYGGGVTAASLTHVMPSLTPATATGLLFSAAVTDNVGTWTWTHPAGMTEHYDDRGPSNYVMMASASQTHNSTAGTGTRTWTISGTSPTAQASVVGGVLVPSKPGTGDGSGVTFPAPYVPYEPPALVPATVRSYTTRTHSSGNTNNDNALIPSDAVAGDLLLSYIIGDTGTAAEMNKPTGFTELTELMPSGGPRLNVSYRVAQAGDAGTTFAFDSYPSGSDGASICVCIKDWSGNPAQIAVVSGQATRSGTSPNISVVAPSVNPLTEHGLLLTSIALDDDNNGSRTWTFTPPPGMSEVATMTNAAGWSSIGVGAETWAAPTATGTRTWTVATTAVGTIAALSAIVVPSNVASTGGGGGTGPTGGDYTNGSGGDKVDATGLSHTNGVKTSTYHLFAGGLDWNKNVGLLVYTDGSGEYGYQPAQISSQSPYVLYGATGMIAVAKKHNMILLCPMAPGDGCTDNDGVCWYMNSFDGTTQAQKTAWSKSLVDYIMGRYNIDKQRVVLSGYSSGAQWTTQYFGPLHASSVMTDGLMLPISYGGQPIATPNYPTAFKAAVPVVWDVGANDPGYQSDGIYDVQSGYDWYTSNGFAATDLIVVPNKAHDRYNTTTMVGEFGGIVDREITKWVKPA